MFWPSYAIVVMVLLLALVGACGQVVYLDDAIFTPEVIGTAAVPLSESEEVALLADERTACTIDSYESQVRCVDVEGTVIGAFGRIGEGPGEFARPVYLTRGEEGTVGVVDPELSRFTVFEPTGAYLSDVTLRGRLFDPLPSFGTVVSGLSLDYMAMLGGETSGSLMTRFDVNISSGELVREGGSPRGPWDVECGQAVYGIPDRAEGWVFVACEGHLIFIGDEGNATVLRAPMYVPELPNARDVARYKEELMAFQIGLGLPPPPDIAERLESYRVTPKHYYLSTAHQLVDNNNRYWIATQRDTYEWSYLDVYENAKYVKSVKVRGRLRAFDVVRSTLVVLVYRQVGEDNADGIPGRTLNWYDIGDLRLSR